MPIKYCLYTRNKIELNMSSNGSAFDNLDNNCDFGNNFHPLVNALRQYPIAEALISIMERDTPRLSLVCRGLSGFFDNYDIAIKAFPVWELWRISLRKDDRTMIQNLIFNKYNEIDGYTPVEYAAIHAPFDTFKWLISNYPPDNNESIIQLWYYSTQSKSFPDKIFLYIWENYYNNESFGPFEPDRFLLEAIVYFAIKHSLYEVLDSIEKRNHAELENIVNSYSCLNHMVVSKDIKGINFLFEKKCLNLEGLILYSITNHYMEGFLYAVEANRTLCDDDPIEMKKLFNEHVVITALFRHKFDMLRTMMQFDREGVIQKMHRYVNQRSKFHIDLPALNKELGLSLGTLSLP